MYKNATIYRIKNINPDTLHDALSKQRFSSITSLELSTSGWVPPVPHGSLVHKVNNQLLLKLVTQKKVLPAAAIKEEVANRAIELESQQGFYPGRKQLKELKEQITDEFLPRAFSVKKSLSVWIDTINGWLIIDTATNSKAEDVIKLLLAAVDGVEIDYLRTNQSPTTAMTQWLSDGESPYAFSVDQDGVLESVGEGNAKVKYVKHSLDNVGVMQHIAGGKQCISLALTWMNKVSFVLTETLTIRKIEILDVLKESIEVGKDAQERFDSDFALFTGEFNALLTDLAYVLGGEYGTVQTAVLFDRDAAA